VAALDGMRILDLSQYEAGPSCTQALAWLGADVVKIERPGVGDPGRSIGMPDYFMMWNSNKRSVELDLQSDEGRKTLLKMLPKYDVIVENFGPGVIAKLRLDYDSIKEIHPSVIFASVKGFGSFGPYADYKCFDMVAQAAAGAFSVTGESDGPPMRPGTTIGDSGTGTQLAMAILAAYVHLLKTGEGQQVELSMQEGVTYYMRTMMSMAQSGEAVVARQGNGRDPLSTMYPCSPGGPNDFIFLMAITHRMWEALCLTMSREDLLTDPRFLSPGDRLKNAEVLRHEISVWTTQYDKKEAMRRLAEAGVPVSAVMDTVDVYSDPNLIARDFIKEVKTLSGQTLRMPGCPARLSKSDVSLKAAVPLGTHTKEVLMQDLGLDEDQFSELEKSGVLG
jgi:formyl-CoA transferase